MSEIAFKLVPISIPIPDGTFLLNLLECEECGALVYGGKAVGKHSAWHKREIFQ